MIRVGQLRSIVSLLLTFFGRRVLQVGPLRLPVLRIALASCAMLLMTTFIVMARQFLLPYALDDRLWRTVFDLSSLSVILWTMVAFLLIKVLFASSDAFLEQTFQFPITNKERALSIVIFEIIVTLTLALLTMLPLAASAVLLRGIDSLSSILISIIYPTVATYLILSIAYVTVVRILSRFRVATLMALLAIFGIAVIYGSSMIDNTNRAMDSVLDGSFFWPLALVWAYHQSNLILVTFVMLFGMTVLTLGILIIQPNRHVNMNRHVHVRFPQLIARWIQPIDMALWRSQQTAVGAILCGGVFVFLLFRTDFSPLWSLGVLPIGGLYLFNATRVLRMMPLAEVSAFRVYASLIRAPIVLVSFFALPALLISVIFGRGSGWAVAVVSAISVGIVVTCVGIIFPAEKDNPFAVLVGMGVATVCVMFFGLGTSLLKVPIPLSGAVIVAASSFYSILAIREDRKVLRHEKSYVCS